MQLFGSKTSPYVRRIRLFLENRLFEFVVIDIFSSEGRSILQELSPILKIPVLIDGHQKIFDSRVIYRYLCAKFSLIAESLNWDQENILSIIDGVNDSLINRLLLNRSGIELPPASLLDRGHQERITQSLGLLNSLVKNHEFENWNYLSISLYSLLDWAQFRELLVISPYPFLVGFYERNRTRKIVLDTDPRA